MPPVMAALRNTTVGLLRWAGYTNMAAAGRQLAAQPARALALMGIALENCIALKLTGLALPPRILIVLPCHLNKVREASNG
jgi:hypothetical protein